MALLLLETRSGLNNIVLLRPEMLWLGLLIVPLLLLAARRLMALGRRRRSAAVFFQLLSALLMLLAVAEPALSRPNEDLDLVVVLDASSSLSEASRAQAVTYAQGVLDRAGTTERIRFISAANSAAIISNEDVASGSWAAAGETHNKTDLAAGLRLAGSLLSDTGKRRVVLVTDGWQTQGLGADEAARLKARGVAVDVVALGALGDPEIIVRGLDTIPYARAGDSIQSDLRVFSTADITATMTVVVDGSQPATRQITLKKRSEEHTSEL